MKAKEETKPIKCDGFSIDKMIEIRDQSRQINFDDLTYVYEGESAPISFIGFKGPLHIFKSIYNGNIALKDVEKDQKSLKSDLGQIKQGHKKYKSLEQLKTIENVKNLYELKEKVVQMFNN